MPVRPRPHLDCVEPYLPGDSARCGTARVVKLSSNESPLGPSPRAKKAFRSEAMALARYPDAGAQALRRALARCHGIDPNSIVFGAGSESMITLIARTFAGPGDAIAFPRFSFAAYKIAAQVAGARPVPLPEPEPASDDSLVRMADELTEDVRILFVANPGNPTGQCFAVGTITRLRNALDPNVLLVLDRAYAEHANHSVAGYRPGHELVDATMANAVVLRTFSKAYGLAGARIGWAHCPPVVAGALDRVRDIFPVCRASPAAAHASLLDTAHLSRAVEHNARWQPWLRRALEDAGLGTTGNGVNFVLVDFGSPARARAADQHLRREGYIPRTLVEHGLADCLRISVGRASDCRGVARALADLQARGGACCEASGR